MSYMSKANKENIFLMKNNNNMSHVSKVIKIIMICFMYGLKSPCLLEFSRMDQNGQKQLEWAKI